MHLWAATPSDEPVPVAFDEEVRLDGQVVGDTDSTISDPATAVGALAVAAFITRTSVTNTDGASLSAGGPSGALAAFTSRGPTLAPEATGAKPELAAPGSLIVAARSRAMPDDGTLISPLYRATAGTSFATPHAAGAAAVLLSAQPSLDPPALKRLLLETAEPAPDGDSRWGAGRLDVAEALAALVGRTGGCRCVGGQRWPPAGALTLLIAVLIVRRRRAPPEL